MNVYKLSVYQVTQKGKEVFVLDRIIKSESNQEDLRKKFNREYYGMSVRLSLVEDIEIVEAGRTKEESFLQKVSFKRLISKEHKEIISGLNKEIEKLTNEKTKYIKVFESFYFNETFINVKNRKVEVSIHSNSTITLSGTIQDHLFLKESDNA